MDNPAEPADDVQPGEPYCGQCGYSLKGLEDSSRCPECGRSLIDVVMRRGDQVIPGRRYASAATLFGWPVLAIATGSGLGEKRGHARGIIAIGDHATGLLAIGGQARGVVALGGIAIGLFSFGGISIGLLTAVGGLTIGAVAWGGVALGLVVSGGIALGWLAAGGVAIGRHLVGPGTSDSDTIALLGRFAWYYGPTSATEVRTLVQSIVALVAVSLVPTTFIGLLAAFGLWRGRRMVSTTEIAYPLASIDPRTTPRRSRHDDQRQEDLSGDDHR